MENEQGPSEITQSVLRSKRKRGLTRADKWDKKRKESGGAKTKGLMVPLDMGRVVGDPLAVNQFVTETSLMMRQYLPLNVWRWKDVPADAINKVLGEVEAKYELDVNSITVRDAILDQLHRRWGDWRCNLRKHYLKFATDKERLRNCPKRVEENQWRWLVLKYWGSEAFRKKSEAAKANRKKQKMSSCGGSKSIAQTLHENKTQKSVEDAIPENESFLLDYCRLFEIEKKKKDGSWVNEEAEQTYHRLVQLHYDEVEEHGEDNLRIQEAYARVLGHKSGYQKGLGPGAKPLKVIQRDKELVRERVRIIEEVQERVRNELKEDFERRMMEKDKENEARFAQFEEKMTQEEREHESNLKAQVAAVLKSMGIVPEI